MVCLPKESQNNLYVYELLKSRWNMIVRVSVFRNWLVDDSDSWGAQTTTTATATKTSLKKWSRAASNVACENIRFSSLFASGGVSRQTSPAAKSEEKRMFSQATSNVFAPILSRSIRQMLVPNFWSWILNDSVEVQEKIKKVVVFSSLPPQTYNYAFSRRSRAVTAKNCTKKRDARTDLLFCQSKPISFLPFSLTSPWSLLKLATDVSITYAEVIINMDWTPLSTICLRQESSQPKSRLDWQTT